MHRDRLFLETLADLERRAIVQESEYELLMIAGLLRKLLLDGYSLVDEVNSRYRLKIRYTINDDGPPDEPGMVLAIWNSLDGLDPETAPNPRSIDVPVDDFLAHVLMISDGHRYTVRDVIQHHANVAGAVHVGRPKSPAGTALAGNEQSRVSNVWPMQVLNLRAIARVVLRALTPLRAAVEKDLLSGRESAQTLQHQEEA